MASSGPETTGLRPRTAASSYAAAPPSAPPPIDGLEGHRGQRRVGRRGCAPHAVGGRWHRAKLMTTCSPGSNASVRARHVEHVLVHSVGGGDSATGEQRRAPG
jgi:hypothetical protein